MKQPEKNKSDQPPLKKSKSEDVRGEPTVPPKRLQLTTEDGSMSDEIVFHNMAATGAVEADGGGGSSGSGSGKSASQLAKSASRLALYMMRENESNAAAKLAKGGKQQDAVVQHNHDFFVISSCKVFTKFKEWTAPKVGIESEGRQAFAFLSLSIVY